MTLQQYYSNNKQYGSRFYTDTQIMDFTARHSFHGLMDKHARFVENGQLLRTEDWKLFVRQFTFPADDADEGWRGEYFGKMMRGASMVYQYTKNEELYAVLHETALDMLKAQDAEGRFSTYSKKCEFRGWDMWSRKYVILGFLHFHEICRDEALKERIVAALENHLDYIVSHIGDDDGMTPIGNTSGWWGAINSASILEPVIKMYNITGKESYLSFAEYIIDFLCTGNVNIITLALEDKLYPYEYPVTKAYEMMSCFEGLLEYYRITKEEKWLRAVINFADKVKESDITVIGCAGCMHELFNHAAEAQTDTDYDGVMQETCVTVTWMKLCSHLLLLTGEAKYADYIEESLYNALYGSVNTERRTENGGFMFDSYSPLTFSTRGRFIGGHKNIAEDKYYGCCAAIGAAGVALPMMLSATVTDGGIALNYYERGQISARDVTLSLDTDYPADGKIRITIDETKEQEWTLHLRIPAFAGHGTMLYINGEPSSLTPNKNACYIKLTRTWLKGDTVELVIDMNPRILHPMGVDGKPESKNYFAVLYGPLVLARDTSFTDAGTAMALTDDKVTVTPSDHGDHNCTLRATVTLSGKAELDMADYASCGKTWNGDSVTEAWIKCL